MPDGKTKTPEEQKALKGQLDQMVNAFEEFHAIVVQLKKEQKDVENHIRTKIDQKKIDQIHSLLQNM